jgi:hypothetical protein
VIDQQLATFLHDGVGVHIGTRNERREPNGARATAVRVDDDGVHLTVFVPKVAARRVLPDLEANGQAAVVFGRPVDERACQIKGEFVSARPARAQERPLIMAQWERFMANLEYIGIPRAGAALWNTWPSVAIRLKVTAIFEQTPGPKAGAQLA